MPEQSKSLPVSLVFSPTFSHFATTSLPSDRQVRIFNFLTGKLHRKYDESINAIQEMQQAATAGHGVKLDDMEFGRRLAVEKDLQQSESRLRERPVWDETGMFLLYPSLLGIKGLCAAGVCKLTLLKSNDIANSRQHRHK